jgi:hypothetical protein
MASPWAAKRQFMYVSGILGFFVLVIGIPAFILLYKSPTCFDGKQNQGEEGIDCGGTCVALCPVGFVRPTILFSRYSKVANGVYNLLAYIDNPNMLGSTMDTGYIFHVYDKDGMLLGERTGTISIPAGRKIAIFEPSFQTTVREPKNILFELDGDIRWTRPNGDPLFSVSNITVDDSGFYSRVNADITNKSEQTDRNVEVIAIVYDTDGNARMFSRTYLDEVPGLASTPVSFTWPEKFSETPARIDVVVRHLQ